MKVFLDGKEISIESISLQTTQVQEPTEEPATEPDPPVEPAPEATGTLLLDEAATMAPGEWRSLKSKTTWTNMENFSFKDFQVVKGDTGGADGMGWTQPLVHHNGELMAMLCRSHFGQAFMHMDATGHFTRIEEPVGFGSGGERNGGRRPFNRLMRDGKYLYFAPTVPIPGGSSSDMRKAMGVLIRTPLDNPGVFEQVGPAFNDDQVDTNGSFCVIWVEEWNRFYGYTPGGKIWSRAPDDTAWFRHASMPVDVNGYKLSGYAGMLVWNHIKKEILISGGQVFGDNPKTSHKAYRITSPMGAPEMLADRKYPDGTPYYWSHGNGKCLVHPEDGSYLFHSVPDNTSPRTFYRSVTGGGTLHLFEDFSSIKPWGSYESYAVLHLLEDTGVYVYISHIAGLGMYKPASVAGLPADPEDDPVPLPEPGADPAPESESEPNPEPKPEPVPNPSGLAIAAIAKSLQLGVMAPLGGDYSPFANSKSYWAYGAIANDQDTYGATGFWDNVRDKLIYIRDRTPGTHEIPNGVQPKIYDAATEKWLNGNTEAIDSIPFGNAHSYSRQALDQVSGHAYYFAGQMTVSRYLIEADTWEHLNPTPVDTGNEGPACFHEGLGMILRPQAQRTSGAHLVGWKPGSAAWADLGSIGGHDGYQSLMRYNRTRGDMLLVGGNYSSENTRRVTLILADGTVVNKNQIPLADNGEKIFGTGIGLAQLFYDPISGNYLYMSDNRFWEYQPELDEWRLAIDFNLPENSHMSPGPYNGWVMAPVDKFGVIALMSYYGTRLYRHKSVF